MVGLASANSIARTMQHIHSGCLQLLVLGCFSRVGFFPAWIVSDFGGSGSFFDS